jgi:hypothetical protein
MNELIVAPVEMTVQNIIYFKILFPRARRSKYDDDSFAVWCGKNSLDINNVFSWSLFPD